MRGRSGQQRRHALASLLATALLRMCGRREAGEVRISELSDPKTIGQVTHQGDQGDSNFTNLLDDALHCAIVPFRHDPVVSPPDIENTTHALQEIEHEKGELSRKFNEPIKRRAAEKVVGQTM